MERLLSSCEYLSIYASSDVSASKYYSIDGNVMVYSPDLGLPLTYNSFQLKNDVRSEGALYKTPSFLGREWRRSIKLFKFLYGQTQAT